MTNHDKSGEAESRRILDRIQRESATDGIVQRTARRVDDHLTADADRNDKIELWGTRIGRAISVSVSVVVIVFIILYLMR